MALVVGGACPHLSEKCPRRYWRLRRRYIDDYYDDQDLSGFCFLVLIRAFVIQTSLGLQNLNMKGKTKRILVVVVKCANINGLLAFGWREVITGNTPAFAGYNFCF